MSQACNIIKKEILAQVFSCELCEILRTSFFTEHPWVTASDELHNTTFLALNQTKNSALENQSLLKFGVVKKEVKFVPFQEIKMTVKKPCF